MKEFATIPELRAALKPERAAGKRIGFVPTMGYLHEGHLALMREAKKRAEVLVVSIFVNPTQFGPKEDLEKYPRDIERDRKLCTEVGTDYLFVPSAAEMYPPDYSTYVEVFGISEGLCGAGRPGHFRGVATVVAKLFNIVSPDVALFGEKDWQQLAVIRRMSRDLNMDIEIAGVPTVREPDGLAMSSRNSYLSAEERRSALILYKALQRAQDMVNSGEIGADKIIAGLRELLASEPAVELEYLEVVDPDTLRPLSQVSGSALVAIAGRVGQTRLIDNKVIERKT